MVDALDGRVHITFFFCAKRMKKRETCYEWGFQDLEGARPAVASEEVTAALLCVFRWCALSRHVPQWSTGSGNVLQPQTTDICNTFTSSLLADACSNLGSVENKPRGEFEFAVDCMTLFPFCYIIISIFLIIIFPLAAGVSICLYIGEISSLALCAFSLHNRCSF